MAPAIDTLPDDVDALKAIILAERKIARAYEAVIAALRTRIERLRRQKFGRSSEKIAREIEQLELALEDLQIAGGGAADPEDADEETTGDAPTGPENESRTAPRRRGKPRIAEDAPRERVTLDSGEACPDCGGDLRLLGEDIAEILEYVAARLKVIEIARIKKSCRVCQKVVQPPAPTRPIPRSMAGPGLLAHIIIAKYDDHLPLYRQGEIFARLGADIPRSTLIDWCGQAMRTLRPLADRIRERVMETDRLHADDTPVRVLDPALRKAGKDRGVKEGRIWVYVRDDRPWNGSDPPGTAYFFSPDRKGEHPRQHLESFEGILQADAYSGFARLYLPDAQGERRIREAACWAHLRRDFHDVWKGTDSPIAREALGRICALYDIEREITGRSADERHAVRQERSKPKVDAFRVWCEGQLARIPGKGDLAKAMRYALRRWDSFTLFLDDGRVAIDNNPAERALRPISIGRKNWLFAGSDAGGETLADAMTLIETAKLSGLDPEAWLADILARINDHPNPRLDEMLPWNWGNPAERSTRAA